MLTRLFSRPKTIVLVVAAFTAFFGLQFPRMKLDNNNYRFVPENDPARVTSEAIDDDFGSQVFILVGLERPYDTVYSPDFLARVREFDERLSSLDNVDSVSSIVSTDYITSRDDAIVVEPLVGKDFSGSAGEVAEVRRRLSSWDIYKRALVSEDGRATQVLVALDIDSDQAGGEESLGVLDGIRTIGAEVFNDGTKLYLAGLPVLSSNVNTAMKADLRTLIPLVCLVVLLVLFFSFRRFDAIVLPLLTVVIASVWSLGAMPLFGIRLSILSTVLPVILVAVGSAYGIHVITHYIDERAASGKLSRDDHARLVVSLVSKIGKPVFLAALTTFVGFVSFCFTTVLPIREFGFFSSFGVIAAFIVAMTLIPSLLILRGPGRGSKESAGAEGSADEKGATRFPAQEDSLSGAIADTFTSLARKKRMVVLASILLIASSGFLITKLVIDNVMVEYFRDDADVVSADRFVRERFGGTKTVSVVVRGKEPLRVLSPDVLTAMDGLSSYLSTSVPEVGKVIAFTDLVKRINQVYNADEDSAGIKRVSSSVSDGQDLGDFGDFGDFGFESDVIEEETKPVIGAAANPVAKVVLSSAAETQALNKKALVEELARALESSPSASFTDTLDVLKRSVNYEGAAYYEIPADPARYGKTDESELTLLIANYLALISGSIDAYANDPLEPTAIRMNVQLRTVGQLDTERAVAAIDDYARKRFPSDVEVTVGGIAFVERSLNRLVVQSQVVSVFISILMVFLIIAISWKSVVAGLLGIAPLAISILFNFAVMALLGIKLNIGTALVASLAVGIGIDYTIHYLAAYQREYVAAKGDGAFLRRTFVTSGKAIMINAVSVGAGFAVLILSKFTMLAQFGFLIALTMFTSSIVALTVLPVLLKWIDPEFIKKEM